ncbi:30S ribosomal protein S14 [Candidatus Woesearchaeota archaeon]|nr:30S ribosomal protein S14 [Candidatus Woesearchaeota archaeon]
MTTSDYRKEFKQLNSKPAKLKKFIKHNAPKERKFGKSTKHCRFCGSTRGYIGKYGVNTCRRCFRDFAKSIGFKKYS